MHQECHPDQNQHEAHDIANEDDNGHDHPGCWWNANHPGFWGYHDIRIIKLVFVKLSCGRIPYNPSCTGFDVLELSIHSQHETTNNACHVASEEKAVGYHFIG